MKHWRKVTQYISKHLLELVPGMTSLWHACQKPHSQTFFGHEKTYDIQSNLYLHGHTFLNFKIEHFGIHFQKTFSKPSLQLHVQADLFECQTFCSSHVIPLPRGTSERVVSTAQFIFSHRPCTFVSNVRCDATQHCFFDNFTSPFVYFLK